jgi:hypothetical protein
MKDCILQLNFKLNVSPEEYTDTFTPLADSFAAVDGLRWKVWILNEKEREAGGIYLFESPEAMESFLSGDLVAAAASHPALRDLSVKKFDVMPNLTAITRGPVGMEASV